MDQPPPLRYFKVPGMMYPYWVVYEVRGWRHPDDVTLCAHNTVSDTDMGDLWHNEFFDYFPNAVEITKEECDG